MTIEHAQTSALSAVSDLIRNYLDEIQAHDAYFGPMELAYLILDTIDIESRAPVDVPRAHNIWDEWRWNWLRSHGLTAGAREAV